MSKYLITGGAGFIGSNIAKELVRLGEGVVILDNFATGKKENIADVKDKIKLVEGDLRDIEAVKKACGGIDYVLHQGALPSVQRSVENPAATNEVNVQGTLNVLIAAKEAGVKRVIYAASSSAYGDTPTLPKVETMKENPLSPYAVSKLTGEHYSKVFASLFNLETICLRYFNVFGPNQDPTSQYSAVIPRFIIAMLKDESPTIYGDGTQSRDFTFVENVIQANLLAVKTQNREAIAKTCNIACGNKYSLNEMVDALNELMGKKIKPKYAEGRKGDVKHSLADISLAGKLIGYKPKVSFKEGLRRTIEWYKSRAKG